MVIESYSLIFNFHKHKFARVMTLDQWLFWRLCIICLLNVSKYWCPVVQLYKKVLKWAFCIVRLTIILSHISQNVCTLGIFLYDRYNPVFDCFYNFFCISRFPEYSGDKSIAFFIFPKWGGGFYPLNSFFASSSTVNLRFNS